MARPSAGRRCSATPVRPPAALRRLRALVLALGVALPLGALPAAAQDIDWVLNINDTGFDPAAAGSDVAYSIRVENDGTDPAPAVDLTLTIPATTTLVATSGTIICASALPASPGTVTCSVPALSASTAATLVATLRTTAQGTVTLAASVAPGAGETQTANNTASEHTTVTAGANLSLAINGPATASAGSSVTYVLEATNAGPDAALSPRILFPVPTGLAAISAPGCTLAAGTYTCELTGSIAVGASVSRSITGQISAASGSTVTPAASLVAGTPADPLTDDNTASRDTSVTPGSDLRVAKSRSPAGTRLVGDTVTFTLSPSYTGDVPAGITLTDTIPVEYRIDTVTPAAGWSCTVAGQAISCGRAGGTVAGAGVSLGAITVVTTATGSGTPTNTVHVEALSPADPNPANNSASDGGVTIQLPTVDLRANKSGPSPALVVTGQSYDYTISATNTGNTAFWGTLSLTDSLPTGLTVSAITPNGWTCTPAAFPIAGPGTITCERVYALAAPLAAGGTTPAATLHTTATATGSIVNRLDVFSPDANIPGSYTGDDAPVVGYDLPATADLRVMKSASLATLPAGEVQGFPIEIVNDGPVASELVTLTDDLAGLMNNLTGPTGSGIVGVSVTPGLAAGFEASDCTFTPLSGTAVRMSCDVGTLPVCTAGSDCPVVTVNVRPGGEAGARTNAARAVSSVTADPDLTDNTGSAGFTVEARADVTLTKVATPSPVPAGQSLTYVLTARNTANGLSSAADVTVTDTLPHDVTFLSASPSVGACGTQPAAGATIGAGNDQLVCGLGAIANGAQRTITVVVRPNYATYATTITNIAAVATSTIETDATNNGASIAVPVGAPALDLLINMTDSPDPVVVGDLVTYTLTATNLGPSSAENLRLTATLPSAGLTYQSFVAPSDATCGTVPAVGAFSGTLDCTFPTLSAGQSRVVTLTMLAVAKGIYTPTAVVASNETADGFDANTLNNEEGEGTTVRTRADLEVVAKTPSKAAVDLREDFTFRIDVRNNAGAGLAEADETVVTDTLPSNMRLTGTPSVAVTAGTSTLASCTGAAGDSSFSCALGTFSNGGEAQITVPVQVIAATATPMDVTNTATIRTDRSFDPVPGNNSKSGTVTVGSSTIAGRVYRDFADDRGFSAGDTAVSGVTITVTGMAFDGAAISQGAVTAADGSYSFILPEGSYTLSRGTISEAHQNAGAALPGSNAGGSAPDATTIATISLPRVTAAADYDFTIVPVARVGLAKQVVAGPTIRPDGSFDVTFRLLVRNPSLEALEDIEIRDPLAGAAPLFGSLAASATDPMARGSYALTAAPAGTCGGISAGFDGSADTLLATGVTLAAGGTCTIDIALRVRPADPVPPVRPSGGRYENAATVTAAGALSGQTPVTNPQLADTADNGASTDANGNGLANEAGENDPTPVAPAFAAAITLDKQADTTGLGTPPLAGDTVSYRFTVTNSGNVTLTDVTVTDSLPGILLTGVPIPSLAPGASDSTTYSATLVLTQADVDAGTLANTATATGTDPFDADVTDDDTETVALASGPAITLVKTATPAFGVPPRPGDTIAYGFTVTNTGNVTLTNITLTDSLPGITISGGPIANLPPGGNDSTTFSGLYALTQADIDAGLVANQATATGTPPSGPDVSDLSGTTAALNDPTEVTVAQVPAIELVKTVDSTAFLDGADPGDRLTYAFTVTNTGNVTLHGITLADPLPGIAVSGGPIATLAPGASDSTTFTASYEPVGADIAAGFVDNTATVTGAAGAPGGPAVTDDSSARATIMSVDAVAETFPPFATDGGTTTSMLASDRVLGLPATLATGGLTDVTLTVLAQDAGVTLDPATALITLAPGNPAGAYTVTYEICSTVVPAVCDQAVETVHQLPLPGIEATKTQLLVDEGDGLDGVGDRLDYTITVVNTGNVPLADLALADALSTLAGAPLVLDAGPSFVASSLGSPDGTLAIGESATYAARVTLTVPAVVDGGTSNRVTVTALPVHGPGVIGAPATLQDVSDDGDDADGNTVDDPTDYPLAAHFLPAGLAVEKTTPRGVVERDSIVPYTITVRNETAVVVGPVELLDVLPAGFVYLDGTARYEGAGAAVTVEGRVVRWPGLMIPPLGSVTAELSARITPATGAGEYVNRASLRDPATGTLLTPEATAVVRILPEPVFDCGDVIGKVFDDRNRDGVQARTPPGAAEPVEPGLPAVRLAGVDGTLVSTDSHGRFHVPCAMLPPDRGANFILKLDTRTLPAGYRLTTENPRVVRLTPGKMTEMTFGAAIARVVRIDVNANAIVAAPAGPALSPAFAAALDALLRNLAGEAATLRLGYHLAAGESDAGARAGLDAVEAHLRRGWPGIGRTRLVIERTVVREAP